MSAWYVFATLGFYPLDSSSATYVLGHPLARRITLQRDGLQLAITAAPVSKTSTAPTRLTLNGAAFDGPFITHRALTNAHRLHFEASPLQ
jgi:putative alpha-1,2-mannosidase